LIRRADRVCRSAQARIRDTSEELSRLVRSLGRKRISSREYYARSATFTEQAQRAVLDALETLRALGRPPGRQDSLERYLAATGRHAAVTGSIAEALRERRKAELARLNRRWLELSEAAHNAARAYGFKVCGGN
jgi:phosphohistidine phosphatase SixA